MAMLPRMVGEARLAPANALLHTVQDLGVVVGPAIGAILLAVAPDCGRVPRQRSHVRGVGGAHLDDAAPRRARGHAADREHALRAAARAAHRAHHAVRRAAASWSWPWRSSPTAPRPCSSSSTPRSGSTLGAAGYGYLLAVAGLGGLLSATVNARLATSTKVAGIVVVAGALFCATQLAYAWTSELAIALLVTLLGGAGFVACEVVAETALARVVRSEVLGRVMGVFDALSVAAMVLGAVLAPVLIARTSLRTSFVVLGIATVVVTFACLAGLRAARRAEPQARGGCSPRGWRSSSGCRSRVGAPRIVLEQLASASQFCPLPAGGRRRRRGRAGPRLLCRGGRQRARPSQRRGGRAYRAGRLASGSEACSTTRPGMRPSRPRCRARVLRIEGDVLLDALQAAPTVLSAIDRSNKAPRAEAPAAEHARPRWWTTRRGNRHERRTGRRWS